jgi:L-ascorbate metabolism protein UlaG (beta-lactamase superfamily)|tara:strand:- start:628 stop:1437 length:810 start_codon:yes stop_codon:yes gene_type:complete
MDLLYEIEEESIDKNRLDVFFIGQSGYILKTNECIIYIDPYLSDYIENPNGLSDKYMCRNYPSPIDPKKIKKCDAVICTHAHVDHMDPWTINQIKPQFQLHTSIGAYEMSEIALKKKHVEFVYPDKSYQVGPFDLIPFPAAHYQLTDEKGRPDCLSFLIKWRDKSLFFWGDGICYEGQHELLSNIQFDYFFAPINGRDSFREKRGIIGNLKESELANICAQLKIKNVIPNHYDMFNNNTGSISLFQTQINDVCPDQKVTILKCGEKFEA